MEDSCFDLEEQRGDIDHHTNNNCNSSTNEADNTAHGVSATHTQCNSTSGDNLSDVMICDFLASQPNSPKLAREDLEQIDPDDLEEMDLQWEMAMLTIRARRFIQRTGRKLDVNGQRVGFDRTKVECYNCHKYGHFARECRVPRNQENRGRENNRRTMTVETPTENALVAQDKLRGYDWSYQAEEEHPTNFALMAHTSLGILQFKTRLGYNAASSTTDSPAVESFMNSFEMLEIQENNKSRSDKGYHALPPPFTGNFIPRKPDLTFMDEIVESENMVFTTIVTPSNVKTVESNLESAGVKSNGDAVEPKTVRMNRFRPRVIKGWNSDDDVRVAFYKKVNTVKVKDTTARDRAVVGNPQQKEYKEKGVIDSGCSRHMTGNKCYLTEYEDYDGGFVSFRDGKIRISRKGLTCLFAKAKINESKLWHRRCDNGTQFKNSVMNQFCEINGIEREFSVARTPQQNGVAERRNKTLIEASRVLGIKPYNKTPYELIRGRTPLIDFMKPFRCPVTILNTRIVEETLNIRFLENTPNVIGNRPDWLFDVDSLTISMNYVPVVAGKKINGIAGTRDNIVTATRSEFERLLQQEKQSVHLNSTNSINTVSTPVSAVGPSFTNDDPSSPVNAAEASNAFKEHLFERFSPFKNAFTLPPISNVTPMDDTVIFGNAYDDEDVGAKADLNNLETTINVSPIPTTRIDKDYPKGQPNSSQSLMLKPPFYLLESGLELT
ncbi:ribonuclease H-like domain-containing protein [Tanacetum coccineum]